MAQLKVKDTELESYQSGLQTFGMHDAKTVAAKRKCSLATGGRLWKGGPVGRKYMVEILRMTKTRPDDRLENNAYQLDRVVKKYTEEVQNVIGGQPAPRRAAGDVAPIAVMSVYVKFLRLRKESPGAKPFYIKQIERSGATVPVFDEYVIFRTLIFNRVPKPLSVIGRRGDYTDLQPVYPPRLALGHHYLERGSPDVVAHTELEPEPLSQGAFTIINGFQTPENEYVGSLITENCGRLVMVVDMTSLPDDPAKFIEGGMPSGSLERRTAAGVEKHRLAVQKSKTGAFILDTAVACDGTQFESGWNPQTDKLLEHDSYYLRFTINWDAISKE